MEVPTCNWSNVVCGIPAPPTCIVLMNYELCAVQTTHHIHTDLLIYSVVQPRNAFYVKSCNWWEEHCGRNIQHIMREQMQQDCVAKINQRLTLPRLRSTCISKRTLIECVLSFSLKALSNLNIVVLCACVCMLYVWCVCVWRRCFSWYELTLQTLTKAHAVL